MTRWFSLAVLMVQALVLSVSAGAYGQAAPEVYLANGERLAAVKARVQAGDPSLRPAMEALVKLADGAMDEPMRSVVDKPRIPPSGDKNDYVSLSPYWWPNPETEDGLPYVRRDGEINPERYAYDVDKLETFGECVRWLGLAYYFTGEERYAEQAVKRIRHFLLDPSTRMNPRMLHGQFVPGRADGRKYGIIETLRLRWVPDAISLLRSSDAMTEADYEGARRWFGDYAQWLNSSEFGVAERDGANNHGTWAEVQIAYYALFAGDEATVREMAERVPARVADQIEPDGRQPHELKRTRALDYSDFNLRGHTEMALVAEHVGVDLWRFETEQGQGMRVAADWVMPYMTGAKPWPYEQISPPKHDNYAQTLRRLAVGLNDPRYERAVESLRSELSDAGLVYVDLLTPLPEGFAGR